jgi:hypothetical protein
MTINEVAQDKPDRQELKQMNVRMPADLLEAIKIYAHAMDISLNDAVIRAVSEFLGSKGREEAVMSFLDRARKQYRRALDQLAEL